MQECELGDMGQWQYIARSWVRSPITEVFISMLLFMDMALAIYEYTYLVYAGGDAHKNESEEVAVAYIGGVPKSESEPGVLMNDVDRVNV